MRKNLGNLMCSETACHLHQDALSTFAMLSFCAVKPCGMQKGHAFQGIEPQNELVHNNSTLKSRMILKKKPASFELEF